MRFTFSFGADEWLEATGIPSNDEQGEKFHLGGPYVLDASALTSAAFNKGRPMEVRLENDHLLLNIEGLRFRLRRP